MAHFGLLGHQIGYSFSPGYFQAKFEALGLADWRYTLYDEPDAATVRDLFRADSALLGLNVTQPHKQAVLPHLDALDDVARVIGAVNCIRREAAPAAPDGFQLRGFNTDAPALLATLRAWYGGPTTQALVLGTGGAARAACWAVRELGIQPVLASRATGDVRYANLNTLTPYPLIINCTPVGTYPSLEALPPLPVHLLTAAHWVYDLIYNPPQPRLLREAAARGARTHNGLAMLHDQAERAWALWIDAS